MEMEIAVRLQLRVECKSKVYCCMVCGCHGEKGKRGRRRKTDAGFLLSRNAARCPRVYNLGLASSIAMAGKHTRGIM